MQGDRDISFLLYERNWLNVFTIIMLSHCFDIFEQKDHAVMHVEFQILVQ